MQYAFYAVSKQDFNTLELELAGYNKWIQSMLAPGATNRLQSIKEKNKCQTKIEKLLQDQKYIGTIDEAEYETCVKPYIKTQLINEEGLYALAVTLEKEQNYLYQVIKQIMLEERMLCIWVV